MTMREVQGFLLETYGVEVLPSSSARSPTPSWAKSGPGLAAGADVPVVFFDALRVKTREDAVVDKAIYLALGVLPDGTRASGLVDRGH